jgi:hypothetical protein
MKLLDWGEGAGYALGSPLLQHFTRAQALGKGTAASEHNEDFFHIMDNFYSVIGIQLTSP